jgi:hypothetical protein
MSDLSLLVLGVIAALCAAVIFYVFLRKRSRLLETLSHEINGLLRQAEELRLYLSQEGHEWLKPGAVLTEAPVHLRVETPVFLSSLNRLYLLGRRQAGKILDFYAAYENNQRLIEILFARLHQEEEAG